MFPSLGGSTPRWQVLGFVFGAGIFLIIASAFVPGDHWYYNVLRVLLEGCGVASFTAAILAFTIDRWLKSDLSDVTVRETISGIFRPEFRDEVLRITGYPIIADIHNMVANIEPLSDNIVRVTVSVERDFVNHSAKAVPFHGSCHIDEWGFVTEPSKIVTCELHLPNGEVVRSERTYVHDNCTIKADTKEISIPPGGRVKTIVKQSELRRLNDHFIIGFTYPTRNPQFDIIIPDELGHEFDFGSQTGTVEQLRIAKRYTLKGTYFPPAHMRIRWWPKNPENIIQAKL